VAITLTRPAPETVAARARAVHDAWMADPEMPAVLDGCTKYSSDWTDDYGQVLIPNYTVQQDAPPLITDALRVMALKTAVYELTDGDELAAELPVPVPVDTAVHALCAQFTALSRVQERTGHRFVHSTVKEHEAGRAWRLGDYTHQAYRQTFGPVDSRYWIDEPEAERRRQVLDGKYASIGITERGMASTIDFAHA
jgi:Ni/Co efflux regulator RcnB